MFKLSLTLVLTIGLVQHINAICSKCNEESGVACINATSFVPCFGGKPDQTQIFSCGKSELCTDKKFVCINKDDNPWIKPACGDTSLCGKCDTVVDGGFSCTSHTTYTMCFFHELSENRFTCPKGKICDVNKAKEGTFPCVPKCQLNKGTDLQICDSLTPVDSTGTTTAAPTTTTEHATTTDSSITTTTIYAPTFPPTTEEVSTTTGVPTTTIDPANSFCSEQTKVGRYPHPNDTTCKKYIFCFRKGGQMEGNILECPDQWYFNPSTRMCGPEKPANC